MKLISFALLVCMAWAGSVSAQTLRIYQIDVEQADAALVIMPNGRTLLIDSGKNGHGDDFCRRSMRLHLTFAQTGRR
jgi:hypothetical protein